MGGTQRYPLWFCQEELQRHQTGDPTTVSASSLSRWGVRLEPHRMTGNAKRFELVGPDFILLAIVCIHNLSTSNIRRDGHVHL